MQFAPSVTNISTYKCSRSRKIHWAGTRNGGCKRVPSYANTLTRSPSLAAWTPEAGRGRKRGKAIPYPSVLCE